MKRLRDIFESIAYAGMKPGAPPPGPRKPWLGRFREPVERFLAGSASSDPLYLSNRTLGQKIRLGVLIGIPFAAVIAAIAMAALGVFDSPERMPAPAKQLTNAEIAAKMLPDLNKEIALDSNKNLGVAEVAVQHAGGTRVAGTVRNNTDHVITDAEVVFDLTNSTGSRVGAITSRIARVEPKSTAAFSTPIEQSTAAFAVVREVHAR